MMEPIEVLVQRWKQNPNPAATVALCDALRADPRPPLVQQVGDFAKERHASDVSVLISVARLYIEATRFMDAQAVLVAAGKQAPREGRVYRWLGEVLLRRGDAERAEKVLERALQLGGPDADARQWLERASSYRAMQASAGVSAVAAEVAHGDVPRSASGLPRFASDSDADETSSDLFERVETGEIEFAVQAPVPTAPRIPRQVEAALNGVAKPVRPHTNGVAAAGGAHAAPLQSPRPLPPQAQRSAPMPTHRPEPPQLPVTPSPGEETVRTRPRQAAAEAPAEDALLTLRRQPAVAPPASRLPGPNPGLSAPHPRDVLDALTLAGVFEPPAPGAPAVAAWDQAARGPKRKGAPTLVTGMVLFLAASVGIYFFYQHKRGLEHLEAEALLSTVEQELHAARPDALPDLERELTRAFQLDSRSPRAALDWARERAIMGLVKSGADVAFEDAMGRAKDVGIPEEKYAFAHVASFLFQGDTAGAAAALGRWEKAAAGDAWYQLVAGATLERAGDARARDRYATATKLDPDLVAAKTALARATAIDGDAQEAMRLASALRIAMPERAEPVALVALAWGRDPKRDEVHPPPEVGDVARRADELPAGLKFVPHAVLALGALDRRAGADARTAIDGGLAVAETPGSAVWLGTIALSVGDEALARKAALLALQLSAAYEPARALAARVALMGGRIDEALKATEDLDPSSPDVAVVHAAAAYERADVDGIMRALEALPPEARKLPMLSPLDLSDDALSGRVRLDRGRLLTMAADDEPWGDLLAMDIALDGGDLTSGDKIAARWGKDAEAQPLRAVRLARLARYEGRLDAADSLSQTPLLHGTVTPRVLWERGYVLVAKGRATEVGPLLARYPLVLGPLATWLGAYASASGGNADLAKARTASIDPPPPGSPLEARVVAAAALGAMKDKRRGADYVKDVLASGSLHPDLVAAALALGLRRVEHGKRGPTFE
jgi:tetratricopeptide (TPR) repeat protein